MQKISTAILLTTACLSLAAEASAITGKRVIELGANAISAYSPQDTTRGDFFRFVFVVPAGITPATLESANLEFFADVSVRDRTFGSGEQRRVYTSETARVDVFAVKSSFSGTDDPQDYDQDSRVSRLMAIGPNKRVRVDITSIVNGFLATPGSNHGIIVGALTGLKESEFTIKTDRLPNSAVATIEFRWDPSISD